MKFIIISLLTIITINASTIEVQESNGMFVVKEMTVYNLYAKKDGFAQIDKVPNTCGVVHLLDESGKNVGSLYKGYPSANVKVSKGKLKLMVTPEEQCKVSFSIPD